jgi:hypothetical protein
MAMNDERGQERVLAVQVSTYIGDIATELHRMAIGRGMTVLACILNLVIAEADRQAREDREATRAS